MRPLASLALAIAGVFALCGCAAESAAAAAGQFPTVRCPVYEGTPDCSASVESLRAAQQ